MYKQTHISIFILISLSVHIAFLSQYQTTSSPSFEKNDKPLNIILSSHSIKQVNPADKTPNNSTRVVTEKKSFSTKKVSKPIKSDTKKKEIKSTKKINQEQKQISKKNISNKYYIHQITSEIENNKYYPSSAKRRNMQEMVKVSFILLKNGEIENIEISGKYKLLQIAAKTAILDSLPFNNPPMGVVFPLRVNYSMEFKLN